MSSHADKLKLLEQIFFTEAVTVITDIDDKVITTNEIVAYLQEKKYSWLTVMQQGEILFYFDPDSDDKKSKIEEINNVAGVLKKRGITPKPRPANESVIRQFNAQMMPSKQVKKTHQLSVVTDDSANELAERTETQHLLDNLIDAAAKAGSSDIHIETDEKKDISTIKFRVDGKLVVQTSSALALSERMVTRLGSLIIGHEAHTGGGSTSDTFDKNRPVGGSFTIETQARDIKLRYSHMPTSEPKGLSIVMRIVTGDGQGSVPGFKELDYFDSEIALLERILKNPHGVVLFTGPTGSGKSTAMAAGTKIFPDDYKILSFEDPVESKLPNVCQVQIGNNEFTSYGAYSRTALRQDPDVIIYGEIRDSEVMMKTTEQANTGHLVLSTLHTNTPADAIERLVTLGLEPSVLANGSLIRGLIGQRLVARVCKFCCVPLVKAVTLPWASIDHHRVFKYFSDHHPEIISNINTVNLGNNNCPHCKGKGEKGRAPLVEIIMLDQKGRGFIKNRDIDGWLEYLRTKGWRDLKSKAITRIGAGTICPLTAEGILESAFGINVDEFDYGDFEKLSDELNAQVRSSV